MKSIEPSYRDRSGRQDRYGSTSPGDSENLSTPARERGYWSIWMRLGWIFARALPFLRAFWPLIVMAIAMIVVLAVRSCETAGTFVETAPLAALGGAAMLRRITRDRGRDGRRGRAKDCGGSRPC